MVPDRQGSAAHEILKSLNLPYIRPLVDLDIFILVIYKLENRQTRFKARFASYFSKCYDVQFFKNRHLPNGPWNGAWRQPTGNKSFSSFFCALVRGSLIYDIQRSLISLEPKWWLKLMLESKCLFSVRIDTTSESAVQSGTDERIQRTRLSAKPVFCPVITSTVFSTSYKSSIWCQIHLEPIIC